MTHWDLTFTAPTRPLSVNRSNGMHYRARARLLDPWKDVAWALARNALIQEAARRREMYKNAAWRAVPAPITVQVVLPFRQANRRDAHNYTGTNVKAVVDGLVRAGIVPDDTPEWVTVLDPEFVIVRDKAEPLTATIRIRPRETP